MIFHIHTHINLQNINILVDFKSDLNVSDLVSIFQKYHTQKFVNFLHKTLVKVKNRPNFWNFCTYSTIFWARLLMKPHKSQCHLISILLSSYLTNTSIWKSNFLWTKDRFLFVERWLSINFVCGCSQKNFVDFFLVKILCVNPSQNFVCGP